MTTALFPEITRKDSNKSGQKRTETSDSLKKNFFSFLAYSSSFILYWVQSLLGRKSMCVEGSGVVGRPTQSPLRVPEGIKAQSMLGPASSVGLVTGDFHTFPIRLLELFSFAVSSELVYL